MVFHLKINKEALLSIHLWLKIETLLASWKKQGQ
jgi:hypothetical protein